MNQFINIRRDLLLLFRVIRVMLLNTNLAVFSNLKQDSQHLSLYILISSLFNDISLINRYFKHTKQ